MGSGAEKQGTLNLFDMVADAVNCLPACLLPSILPFCPPTQSNRAEMQHMEAEIARLQALKEDEARLTEGRHLSCIEW